MADSKNKSYEMGCGKMKVVIEKISFSEKLCVNWRRRLLKINI